ncbi:MAG TPA: CPBP family intramembrane glutamic endopeptidase [Aestuariivirgaceae bacterium]|nr:CPBP family intramembrane glutamic endopeptidase [Aestuariivirgaceae bacterium]
MIRPYEYRPAWFYVMAYAGSWLPWFLGLYLGSQPTFARYAPLLNFIGLFGPIGASSVLILTSGNVPLQSDFKDRLLDLRRIRPLLALLAVVLPFAVIGLSILMSLWFGQSTDQLRFVDGSTIIPLIVLGLILAPIYEETGWHGYGVDSLRARNGVMPATLQFAVLWCAWHAPLVLIPGTYQHGLAIMDNKIFVANFFVSIIPVAFVANWFYYRNDRSIAASILLHSMLNAASILIDAGQVAKCIATLLYSAIAAALVIGDQSLFAQGQRNFVSTRSPAPEGH